ncbi:MAG: YicC family protein [Clostridia bacterium]|nr:YicC family protein [Clostridia bacterium]
MIKSMTGFGRSKYENDSREYLVEIKSVNNRFNDVNIKIPRAIGFLEEKVKKVITNSVSRGKIDVFISFTNNSEKGKSIKINTELAKLYVQEIKKLAQDANIIDNVSVMEVTKLPEVFTIKLEEDDEELLWNELEICLKDAINNFVQMRTNEGEKIKKDLVERIEIIKAKIKKISAISTGLVDEYIVKLEKRIKDILKTNVVDEARLAQEVVIYSDKCSVEEEITRLKSHISQFLGLLDSDIAIGKKIDFLIQEMNRETNTIGSKANNLEITNLVVDIKTEIENIREQIQNIE